ncbi:hypothetical protein [Virgibacillus sp. DJP39]|uniref:hypothetical protein n=1 Tax=Virgibacillus sp. DJP39 TaxID=3409790 RepID=UPI003BB7F887
MYNIEADFEQLIKKLPDKQNRDFELMVTEFVIRQEEGNLTLFTDYVERVLNTSDNKFYNYIAFICLATLNRRLEQISHLNLLFERYGSDFKSQPLYLHYRALKHKSNGKLGDSIADSLKALENPTLSDHSGILHSYAESVIVLLENGDEVNFSPMNSLEKKAYEDLLCAIREDQGYAKFYATKARFLSYRNQFSEAKLALKHAIELEKKGSDYQLRIAKYYQLLSYVQVKEELMKNKIEQKEYNTEMDANIKKLILPWILKLMSRKKNMEITFTKQNK